MRDETIFERAIGLSESAREKYLDEACTDDDQQRQRIEKLVEAHCQADSLLDTEFVVKNGAHARPEVPLELGDFEILSELGRGGMGVVYKAHQKSLNRIVALKVLSNGLGLSSRAVLRFRREAEAAGKLHHTNIVPVYTTGEDRGVHYYAMEWIDGLSLDRVIKDLREQEQWNDPDTEQPASDIPDWLRETALYASNRNDKQSTNQSASSASTVAKGTRYFDHVATIIADVAEALDHAHEHGVVHRDIKPSNLLLGPDGRLSVNDFGLARMLEQPGMTMTGEFVGSPLYMSPEQITAGRAPLDHRTDIYSLGATLYELLAHQPPFPGSSRDQVIAQVMHKDAKSPRKINHKVPVDLNAICMKAIEKDPDHRYQTAEQFAGDLRAYVNRRAINVPRFDPVRTAVKFVRRNLLACSFVTVVALVIAASGLLLHSQHTELQNSRRKNAMQLALLHSLNQNFPAANRQILIARENGASDGWCHMAEAQISVYQADYDVARRKLTSARDAGAPKIPTTSLMAVATLIAGDEMSHLDELVALSSALDNSHLVPNAPEDFLYLSLAYMWADPDRSLSFLNTASEGGISGDVANIIRSAASGHAALDRSDPEEGLRLAQAAVTAAAAVQADDNAFNLARLIQARTIAATYYRILGQKNANYQQVVEDADGDLPDAEATRNADLNHSIYCLYLQTGREDQAFKFLMDLEQSRMDDYSRAYRIIAQIQHGDIGQARIDYEAIQTDREYRLPLLTLVELANMQSDEQLLPLASAFESFIDKRWQHDNELHLGLCWTVCRLLKMKQHETACLKRMDQVFFKYESTYMEKLYGPMLAVARGEDPKTIEIEARKRSRKQLTSALFSLGVDALSRGDKQSARRYFEQCVAEGWYRFYFCHTARAFLAKMEKDEAWGDRIAAIPAWVSPDGEEKGK